MSERKKRWLRRKDAAQIERNRDSRGSAAGRHCRRFSAAFYIPTCWGGIFQFAYPPIVHHTGTAAGFLRCYHGRLCCNIHCWSDNKMRREHVELQSLTNLLCRLLIVKKERHTST